MIDAISGGNLRPPPPSNNGQNLNEEQLLSIEEILESYDPTNLTEEDAANIVEAFSDANIRPSASFAEALAEFGFDAREIGDLANVGQAVKSEKQPNGSKEVDLASVVSFLSQQSDSDTENSDNLQASLTSHFGLAQGQNLINLTA